MKKKLLSVVLTAVMAATVLTGCGSTDNGTASTTTGSAAQTEAATSTDGKVYNLSLIHIQMCIRDSGMGISVGRLREDTVYDFKFVGLSHNTLRGAAGGALLCAELLKAQGYITKK